MSDMSNLYRAYSAVHNVEIKEELQQNRDLISEMNLTQVLQSDLVEVCEEIVEGLFEYGLDLDETCVVISALLEEVTEGTSNELREGKIDQIAEAFGTVVDTVTDKAERNCEEEFLLYRQNKPLTEKWNNKVSHEVGNAKLHASLIHEDRHQIKFGLIEMMSDLIEGMHRDAKTGEVVDKAEVGKTYYPNMPKKQSSVKKQKVDPFGGRFKKEEVSTLRKDWGDAYTAIYEKKKLDPVGQEDDDVDNDGDSDSSDKYLKKRRKTIGKAMGKDEDDKEDGGMDEGYQPMTPERTARVERAKKKAYDDDHYAQKKGDKGEANKQFKRRMAMDSRTKMKKEEVIVQSHKPFSEAELARIEEIVNSWED